MRLHRIPSKASWIISNQKGQFFAVAILTILGVCTLFNERTSIVQTFDTKNEEASSSSSSLERRTIENVNVLLERPKPNNTIKGILFLAHGCQHSHTDFWPSTSKICPDCIGLPEERAIVQMALNDFEFMVVAISSKDREYKCWSVDDEAIVANVLKTLIKKEETKKVSHKIPILAFGASSGGFFVGFPLIRKMKAIGIPLDGFIAQIAAPDCRSELPTKQEEEEEEGSFPIATYITMDRDEQSDDRVSMIVDDLHEKGYPAKHIQLPPLAIEKSFFHDRIPTTISLEQSTVMVQALHKSDFLDASSNELKHDPRHSSWRDVVREHVVCPPDCLVADKSPISEVMNVAYGMHEMSRDGVHDAIDFILKELDKQN